ncbi:MAG: hypothetical protein JXM68_09675 [Sedimentisphaerales bacterium]|nr:hypothetical protein [Sedimentisphaerales bacterium]
MSINHHNEHNSSSEKISNPNIEPLDPGSQALSDALKFSFMLLRLLMILFLAGFVASGFYKIEANEVGVELIFGKVKNLGSPDALLKTGLHWKWPSPIEEVVRIPVGVEQKIIVDRVDGMDKPASWYYISDEQRLKKNFFPSPKLEFVKDGYTLTASASALSRAQGRSADDQMIDYNLCHTNWTIIWKVVEGKEMKVFEKVWDGTARWERLSTILRTMLADSVIAISARYDIEDIIWGNSEKFKLEVQDYMKTRLDAYDIGIDVRLQLVGKETPQQVKEAFDMANGAEQQAEKLKNEAKGRYEEMINQAHANASNILARARAYSDTVVQSAKADAAYLSEVLTKIDKAANEAVAETEPDFAAKRQQVYNELLAITVDQLYQETVRVVMANVEQSFAPTTSPDKPDEWRIYMNRDPKIKKQ